MAVAIVSVILIVNIVLWIVFFVQFRKRYSAEKIIDDARRAMNEMTADIDRTTSRNIDLMNESISRMKALSRELDKKNEALEKKLALINSDLDIKNNSGRIYQSSASAKKTVPQKSAVNPDAVYEVSKPRQNDLFTEDEINIKDEVVITNEGAAYREVPVISAKVLNENTYQNPSPGIKPKEKSNSEKVMDLFGKGKTVEEIAAELSLSVMEVQFIIDME